MTQATNLLKASLTEWGTKKTDKNELCVAGKMCICFGNWATTFFFSDWPLGSLYDYGITWQSLIYLISDAGQKM